MRDAASVAVLFIFQLPAMTALRFALFIGIFSVLKDIARRPAGEKPQGQAGFPPPLQKSLMAPAMQAMPGSSLPSRYSRLSAAARGDVRHLVGIAQLHHGSRAVTAADDRGGVCFSQGFRYRLGAGGQNRVLEHAHGAVPHNGLGALHRAGKQLHRFGADVKAHHVGRDLVRIHTLRRAISASMGSGKAEATVVSTGSSRETPFSSAFFSISLQ